MENTSSSLSPGDVNFTTTPYPLRKLPADPKFYLYLLSLIVASLWIFYAVYVHSRIIGWLLTLVIRKFYHKDKGPHIEFGSFSLSMIGGKIMFRNFVYICEDYSVRVLDGVVIFRYWFPYVYMEHLSDFEKSEDRLLVQLNGAEIHIYNHSKKYREMERIFGMTQTMGGQSDDVDDEDLEKSENKTDETSGEFRGRWHWRELIPVIEFKISSGRVIFGNKLIPHTAVVVFEDANGHYTIKQPESAYDEMTHFLECSFQQSKVILVPSHNYTGPDKDDPPRHMGEGFIAFEASLVDVLYTFDDPGMVPVGPERVRYVSVQNDINIETTHPIQKLEIRVGREGKKPSKWPLTKIRYGPWVDRQRTALWKFFFPTDYQPMPVTQLPTVGQRRVYKDLSVSVIFQSKVEGELLFRSSDGEPQVLYFTTDKGTCCSSVIPWITGENGYSSAINGQLMWASTETNLGYRKLLDCETFAFSIGIGYPRVWNDKQTWDINLTVHKASAYILYAHKHFISDLLNEWTSSGVPDLYHFIPYTMDFAISCKDLEVITFVNQYNWIDCDTFIKEETPTDDNAKIGICGQLLEVSFGLPNMEFLPESLPLEFDFLGEILIGKFCLPESNTCCLPTVTLSEHLKLQSSTGNIWTQPIPPEYERYFQSATKHKFWVPAAFSPRVGLRLSYTYYPMPTLRDYTGFMKQSMSQSKSEPRLIELDLDETGRERSQPSEFDSSEMDPDLICVELEVSSINICAYGSLIRCILNLKENYFGEDQRFTDFAKGVCGLSEKSESDLKAGQVFDPRQYRPFELTLSISIDSLYGHLPKYCNDSDPPCASVKIDRFAFEMDKRYLETKLQFILTPILVQLSDYAKRDSTYAEIGNTGFLALSSVQFRGHALFSHFGLPVCAPTLEYGWLVEVILGDLVGKITAPQLQSIIEFAQTFVFLAENTENMLSKPFSYKFCQHMTPQEYCKNTERLGFPCPEETDVKYRMFRLSLEYIEVFLMESDHALAVQLFPVRLSTCTRHEGEVKKKPGVTGTVKHFHMRQMVAKYMGQQIDHWMESGGFCIGPIAVDAGRDFARAELHEIQENFLRLHDQRTQNLWFMWPAMQQVHPGLSGCGCVGNCRFFGNNRNGKDFFNLDVVPSDNMLFKIEQGGFGQSLFVDPGQELTATFMKRLPRKPSFIRIYQCPVGADIQLFADLPETASQSSPLKRFKKQSSHGSMSKLPDENSASDINTHKRKFSLDIPMRKAYSPVESPLKFRKSKLADGDAATINDPLEDDPVLLRQHPSEITSISSGGTDEIGYFSADETSQRPRADSDKRNSRTSRTLERPFSSGTDATFHDARHFLSSGESVRTSEFQSALSSFGITDCESNLSRSSSTSTMSFASASGEIANDDDIQVDETVNLWSQMNMPIMKSHLLCGCYDNHLSQTEFSWQNTIPKLNELSRPLFFKDRSCQFANTGGELDDVFVPKWFPSICLQERNFDMNCIRSRHQSPIMTQSLEEESSLSTSYPIEQAMDEESEGGTSETMASVQISGSLNIFVTPLLLESAQKYLEILTPELSDSHPLQIVSQLHAETVAKVKSLNRLKSQATTPITPKKFSRRQDHTDSMMIDDEKSEPQVRKSRLQAAICISKINICLLQVSIVQDILPSFAALSDTDALTCSSLFTACFDTIKCQFSLTKQSRRAGTLEQTPADSRETQLATGSPTQSSMDSLTDGSLGELFMREMGGELQISRTHLQLRRLHKQAGFLNKDVILTAIPKNRSQVFFALQSQPSSPRFRMTDSQETLQGIVDFQDNFGFIMAEAGFEEIRLNLSRQKGFAEPDSTLDQQRMNDIDSKLKEVQTHLQEELEAKETRLPSAGAPVAHATVTSRPTDGDDNVSMTSRNTISSSEDDEDEYWLHEKTGNLSSFHLHLQRIWFHCSSPPYVPHSRNIKFTRLDWNILSTTTPSVNAYLTASHRLSTAVHSLRIGKNTHRMGVTACILLQASESSEIHPIEFNRADCLTNRSRILRNDASCQSCVMFWRYLQKHGLDAIMDATKPHSMPPLLTLQKGVFAVTRQWSRLIPAVVKKNFRPLFQDVYPYVALTALASEASEQLGDETTSLLRAGSLASIGSKKNQPETEAPAQEIPTVAVVDKKRPTQLAVGGERQAAAMRRTRSLEQIRDILVQHNIGVGKKRRRLLRESRENLQRFDPELPEMNDRLRTEDLIKWLASQENGITFAPLLPNDNGQQDQKQEVMYTVSAVHLADTQILLKPFLESLGIYVHGPQQTAFLRKLGNIHLGFDLEENLEVHIIDADQSKNESSSANIVDLYRRDMPNLQLTSFSANASMKDFMQPEQGSEEAGDDMEMTVALQRLEKIATTQLFLRFSIGCIQQHVNMPLLRLAHQCVAVGQNIFAVREELKGMQKDSSDSSSFRRHKKQDSGSSTQTQPEVFIMSQKQKNVDDGSDKSDGSTKRSRRSSNTRRDKRGRALQHSHAVDVKEAMPVGLEPHEMSTPSSEKASLIGHVDENTPLCWKHLYALLDIYAHMPETKTWGLSVKPRLTVITEEEVEQPGSREQMHLTSVEKPEILSSAPAQVTTEHEVEQTKLQKASKNVFLGESVPLAVVGQATIREIKFLTTLSGLKLEGNVAKLQAAVTHRETLKGVSKRKFAESFANIVCSGASFTLSEETETFTQTDVVRLTLSRSESTVFSLLKRNSVKNSGLMKIGRIDISIPEHPVKLHGVVARRGKKLTNMVEELKIRPTPNRQSLDPASPVMTSGARPIERIMKNEPISRFSSIRFKGVLDGLSVSARLLPSLEAQYQMDAITAHGIAQKKSTFTLLLPNHKLSFSSKASFRDLDLPASAEVVLPYIHVQGSYTGSDDSIETIAHFGSLTASAEVGSFEQSLTTELLNHLIFAQKIFMKEINEVVQRVYQGAEIPLPQTEDRKLSKPLLYDISLKLKGIQVTATTPTSNAVRFETGAVELQLSNDSSKDPSPSSKFSKLFVRVKVGLKLNLALGTLIKDPMYEEATPEFQPLTFFKTKIVVRNALQQDANIIGSSEREAILITLQRPVIMVQPVALDKAVIVWVNYKNAYDFWNEQRANLEKEVQAATQQILEKLPQLHIPPAIAAPFTSLLFQLTVEDLGICLPLNMPQPKTPSTSKIVRTAEVDPKEALVLTLETTQISASSFPSLVCKGSFTQFCLRFAEDFETSLDDWKPTLVSPGIVMNAFVVPSGTYDICSITKAAKITNSINPQWILNVFWKMRGIDVHLDTSVGTFCTALANTLTSMWEDDENEVSSSSSKSEDEDDDCSSPPDDEDAFTDLPEFVYDRTLDPKNRARLIEAEMNKQAILVHDLKVLGANEKTLELEEGKLSELQMVLFRDFRRDFISKLHHSGRRASVLRDKLGLGYKPVKSASHHVRARSFFSPLNVRRTIAADPLSTTVDLGTPRQLEHSLERKRSLPDLSELSDEISTTSTIKPMETDEDRTSATSTVRPVGADTHSLKSGDSGGGAKFLKQIVDFQLDIRVECESGHWELHSNAADEEVETKTKTLRERLLPSLSKPPVPPARKSKLRPSQSQSAFENTVFLSPGISIRIRYASETTKLDMTPSPRPTSPAQKFPALDERKEVGITETLSTTSSKSGILKRAQAHVWVALQSLSEEVTISPSVLIFLEQVLEPIPVDARSPSPVSTEEGDSFDLGMTELVTGNTSLATTQSSFPVDVLVFVCVQPSKIRFNCHPVSRVECILQIPLLEIVFCSRGGTDESKKITSALKPKSFSQTSEPSAASSMIDDSPLGVSITAAMQDFSLYIFHPYGGGQNAKTTSFALLGGKLPEETEKLTSSYLSDTNDSKRKDALSLHVDSMKLNLLRQHHKCPTKQSDSQSPDAIVRFSTVCDIGAASFKYDMHRLSEILALPKAWYRSAIAKRLFFGDESLLADDATPPKAIPRTPLRTSHSNIHPSTPAAERPTYADVRRSLSSRTPLLRRLSSTQMPSIVETQANVRWETRILLIFNLQRVDLDVNMSQVMANTVWSTKNIQCESKLSIDSTGHKDLRMNSSVTSSSLEAQGGVIGGHVSMENIESQIELREDPRMIPYHGARIGVSAVEVKIDYMGSSMFMGRICSLKCLVNDEWRLFLEKKPPSDSRPQAVFVHGDLHWDQLHIIISRSTTPDLVRIISRLREFFIRHIEDSKRTLSGVGGFSSSLQRSSSPSKASADSQDDLFVRHHRHWQKVINGLSKRSSLLLPAALTSIGTVFGGTMDLHGNNLSLACFHGINFKTKQWAVFMLTEPHIAFTTEARVVLNKQSLSEQIRVSQNLMFQLGDDAVQKVEVRKMTRWCPRGLANKLLWFSTKINYCVPSICAPSWRNLTASIWPRYVGYPGNFPVRSR